MCVFSCEEHSRWCLRTLRQRTVLLRHKLFVFFFLFALSFSQRSLELRAIQCCLHFSIALFDAIEFLFVHFGCYALLRLRLRFFFVVAQCVAQHNKVHVQLNVRERDGMKNMNIFYCVMNHGYVREAWFT